MGQLIHSFWWGLFSHPLCTDFKVNTSVSSVYLFSASFHLKMMRCKVLVRNWNYIYFGLCKLLKQFYYMNKLIEKVAKYTLIQACLVLEISLSKQLCKRKQTKMKLYSTTCVGFLPSNFFTVGNNNGKNKEVM